MAFYGIKGDFETDLGRWVRTSFTFVHTPENT